MECTVTYQMGIQIYDQISTSRIWSKLKLHHSISLRFGLKEKVEAFRPWFDQVRATLNFEKLLKSETSSCLLDRVGLKGGQNRLEHCESWRACLFI